MVKKTTLSEDIDFYLRRIRVQVQALPSVEAGWYETDLPAHVTPDDVYADQAGFRFEWPDVMDRMAHYLYKPFRAGRMSPAQADEYRALLMLIGEMLPVMKRMRLALPPAPVLEAVAEIRDARSSTPAH